MKVSVITRHSVANYGSILQSYATQKAINKLNCDCEIIDYTKIEEQGKNIARTLCENSKFWSRNVFLKLIYYILQTPNYLYSYNKFKKYRKQLLKQTEIEYSSFEELCERPPMADVYCSGSDQIWGKIGTDEVDKAYFLEFVPKGARCISYAASIGKAAISNETKLALKTYLTKYESIFVREKTAVEIIKKEGIDNVKLVLDPTLLLENNEWEKLIKSKPKFKKYILLYQLHDNPRFVEYAKSFSKQTGIELVRICPSVQSLFRGGKGVFLPTPQEFLSLFKNAEYVITDSFHGTVFSLLFNRKFIDVLPSETGTRIINILELTKLEDRILKDYNDFSYIGKDVDFTEANAILNDERKKSIELLKNALMNG